MANVPEHLHQLLGLVGILSEDLERAGALVSGTPSQFHRRQYVRSLFAMLDGVASSWKQIALNAADRLDVTLSPGERAVCREESYDLDDRGVVRVRVLFPRWGSNLRFALNIAPKVYGVEERLNFEDRGWQDLVAASKIRNRLMHPSSMADLQVSDDDIATIRRAEAWFRKEASGIARAIERAARQKE